MGLKGLGSVVVLMLVGCVIPTQAIVARFEPKEPGVAFRGCVVSLGWSARELVAQCGLPDAWFYRAGTDEICLAYETRSFAFIGAGGERDTKHVMVCLRRFSGSIGKKTPQWASDWRDIGPIDASEATRFTVESVFGISALPAAPLIRTSTSG